MIEAFKEALIAARDEDWAECAEMYATAFTNAKVTWPIRNNVFAGFCSVVRDEKKVTPKKPFRNLLELTCGNSGEQAAFRVQACLTLTFGWHVKQEFRTALRIYQSAVDVGVSATDAEMSELVKVPDAAAAECVPHTRPRAHTHVLPKRPARLTRAAPPFAQLRVR